jgi:hypothetical protein
MNLKSSKIRNVKVLIGKCEGTGERIILKYINNFENINFIHLDEDMVQWQAAVSTVMNHQVT